MDTEKVIEFLSQVPLLQRLPSSSHGKIASLVQIKHYEPGDYIVREGEPVEGLCLILDGQAGVLSSSNMEERNQILLTKYDYFSHGSTGSTHQVNIVALSTVTCFFLANKYICLIWNSEEAPKNFSVVEDILQLEPLQVDIFQGITLPDAPKFRQVFGGQLIGQALAAASNTVDCFKLVHSLHATFIIPGDYSVPIIYQVDRVRDGNSFSIRRIDAKQNGSVIFTLTASFQKEELGFDHQIVSMPSVSSPDTLASMEELRERQITDPGLPPHYRNRVAREKYIPWPIEIRFCEINSTQHASKPSLHYWFRARGKLSDHAALHRCVVAYASDLIFAAIRVNSQWTHGLKTRALSLDHSMWFHRPVKADDWLLYVIESPTAYRGRRLFTVRMYNTKGELMVSLTQEALIRTAKPPQQPPNPRL